MSGRTACARETVSKTKMKTKRKKKTNTVMWSLPVVQLVPFQNTTTGDQHLLLGNLSHLAGGGVEVEE